MRAVFKSSSWHLAEHLYRFCQRGLEARGVSNKHTRLAFDDLKGDVQAVWIELARHTQSEVLHCRLSLQESLEIDGCRERLLKAEKARLQKDLAIVNDTIASLRHQISEADVLLREMNEEPAQEIANATMI